MVRNQELFKREEVDTLTPAEENSEVHRFLGRRYLVPCHASPNHQTNKKILQTMYCRLDNLDDEYLSKYYDKKIYMMNTGSVTLGSKEYFAWGKNVLKLAQTLLIEETLHRNPNHGFAKGKNNIMENRAFIQHFKSLYKKYSDISDPKEMMRSAGAVYEIVINKVVHS